MAKAFSGHGTFSAKTRTAPGKPGSWSPWFYLRPPCIFFLNPLVCPTQFTTQYFSSSVSAWTSLLQPPRSGIFVPSRSCHSKLSWQRSLYCNGCCVSLAVINSLKTGTLFFSYLYSQSLVESPAHNRCSMKFS